MYEMKYRRYITKSQSRFAEPEEIIETLSPLCKRGVRTGGVPLYNEGSTLYVDGTDVHSMIIGPTGCKKTRTAIYATAASVIEAGESAVINDPKGEIYMHTAPRAKELGAEVYVINFRDPDKSHLWNPLARAQRCHKAGRETEAVQTVNDFVEAVVAPEMSCTNDRYWVDSARTFLNALALILMASVPENYFNISNLVQLCYEKNRDALRKMLEDMDPKSTAAFGLHTVVDLSAERTLSCVYSSLLAVLAPFTQNEELMNMLCDSSFELENLGRKQTVVYVIYPDEKSSLNFLVNAFLTQCYEVLISTAAMLGGRLPLRVNFIIDEFSNLPAIQSFDNRISEARSRNIRYILCIQSFDQLRQKYKDCAETILSNCGNWLCFSSKETGFLEKVSAVCGREVDYNGIEHNLISPFDMQHLRKSRESTEVLIVRQGLHPYVALLPDFEQVKSFAGYRCARYPAVSARSKAKFISFEEWFQKVMLSPDFSFPYPRKGFIKV